jgi:hypothetical protein
MFTFAAARGAHLEARAFGDRLWVRVRAVPNCRAHKHVPVSIRACPQSFMEGEEDVGELVGRSLFERSQKAHDLPFG